MASSKTEANLYYLLITIINTYQFQWRLSFPRFTFSLHKQCVTQKLGVKYKNSEMHKLQRTQNIPSRLRETLNSVLVIRVLAVHSFGDQVHNSQWHIKRRIKLQSYLHSPINKHLKLEVASKWKVVSAQLVGL